MFYKLDDQSFKKLMEINNVLNQIEIKGQTNVIYMANVFAFLNQVINYAEVNKDEGIIIDNTKKGV
jgi:hypothetical protein